MQMSPSTEQVDQPLSANGRFNRLSYLGWLCLFGFVFSAAATAVMFISGAGVALMTASTDPSQLTGASFGILFSLGMFVLAVFAIYISFVFAIRRLHDTDTTGWLSLLLLVPVINVFLILFLLFAPGTQGPNRFGNVRPSKEWEKILAWIYIVLTVLGIVFLGASFGYIMSSMGSMNPADMPIENIPSSNSY